MLNTEKAGAYAVQISDRSCVAQPAQPYKNLVFPSLFQMTDQTVCRDTSAHFLLCHQKDNFFSFRVHRSNFGGVPW